MTEANYKMSCALQLIFNSVRPQRPPVRVMTGFENGEQNAFVNAFNECFPGTCVELHGCYFHCAKYIWHMTQNLGLVQRYGEELAESPIIKQFFALALVEEDDVA